MTRRRCQFLATRVVVTIALLSCLAACAPAVRLVAPETRAEVKRKSADLEATSATRALALSRRTAGQFVTDCLPFSEPTQDAPISESCGAAGADDSTPAEAAEFVRKNELCAAGGPADVSIRALVEMERIARDFVDENGTDVWRSEDRSQLEDFAELASTGAIIGEGAHVRIKGYIHKVTVNTGEKVNCRETGVANNDLHIVLTESRSDAECEAVVAEAIPHFRPASWTKANLKSLVGGPPVRISGAAFFDGRHGDGSCRGTATPRRAANWEVHPVYRIDVCTKNSMRACDASDESLWVSLGDYVGR